MAPIQAVLVSSPDEGTVSSLTSILRDRWPVRTATTAEKTKSSLDESVTVVIFDDAFESISLADLTGLLDRNAPHAQVLLLGARPDASGADATIAHDVDENAVSETVSRLQARSEYDRLLSEFYALARVRGERVTDEGATSADESTADLEELKRKLDTLAADLDDDDAFDVAL